jgi:hypothetical protein
VTIEASPLDDLAAQIEAKALIAGIPLEIRRGSADGFGLESATLLDLSVPGSGHRVRVWNEGQGDFWIEVAGVTAAWWRHGRKEATLAEVVITLVEGRFSVRKGRIMVSPRGRTSIALADRM